MKAPAFQFYADTWLGSLRVQLMSLEEEGAYIRCLAYCWRHGSIPADPEMIARLIGKGCSTTVATTVANMFTKSKKHGELIHDRLEVERIKQAAWRAKCSAGGKAKGSKKGSTKGSSAFRLQSPSPSSSTINDVPNLPQSLAPEPKPRARNEAADALATACGTDPMQLTASAAKTCAIKANEIKRVCPTVDATEFARRAANYRLHMPDALLTPAALCAHWARCDAPPVRAPAQKSLYADAF